MRNDNFYKTTIYRQIEELEEEKERLHNDGLEKNLQRILSISKKLDKLYNEYDNNHF